MITDALKALSAPRLLPGFLKIKVEKGEAKLGQATTVGQAARVVGHPLGSKVPRKATAVDAGPSCLVTVKHFKCVVNPGHD